MSTANQTHPAPTDRAGAPPLAGPALAALVGAGLFIAFFGYGMSRPDVEGDPYGLVEWLVTVVLVAAAVGVSLMFARAAARRDTARVALALAVLGAVTFVAFWAGWIHVLSTVAAFLALRSQRETGRWAPAAVAALVLSLAALAAGCVLVVVG